MKNIVIAGLGILLLMGCHHKVVVKPVDRHGSSEEPDFRGKVYASSSRLYPAYFDFDRVTLRTDSMILLQKNSLVIMDHPDWVFLIEGNCDERGSEGYNLGIGQLRAKAVRDYYRTLGIDGGRIATVSNGKERPICEEHTEDCWEMNRRAGTKLRER